MQSLEADYLIVGAGAMGMAFADSLIAESACNIIMVDRYHQAGGHWHVAYPHVRLHQPSAFYGVNSKHLGSDHLDSTGGNKGLYELATHGEVCAYFDQVMQQQFLPSGRVQFFPMCEYDGNGQFHSLVSATRYSVKAKNVVDATYMNVTVPAMQSPRYIVKEGVHCHPPNALPSLTGKYDQYVVVGAGKTGIDACLFLLTHGVNPDHIRWVMPRDAWLLDRAYIQPGELFADSISNAFFEQSKVMASANSIEALLQGVAAQGLLIRFDDNVWPKMYRCATVTTTELGQLKQIKGLIRLGRVTRIGTDQIELDQGQVPTTSTTLHIDCTADGLERRPQASIFSGKNITLQSVRTCQQVFSAAFIGHVEVSYDDEAHKNYLCTPVPHPNTAVDFLRSGLANAINGAHWAEDEALTTWLQNARLDGFTTPDTGAVLAPAQAAKLKEMTEQMRELGAAAIKNMQRLLAEVED